MPPRPYSERSVLPRDSSNSSVSVDSDSAQMTLDSSPGTLSTATTPSPIDNQMEFSNLVPDAQEELSLLPSATAFYPTPADSMPFDHAFPDFIRQLTNERDLGNVQSLRIKVISRLVSLQRMSLFTTNLRELDLEGSILGSLRDIGCNLKVLQVLKVGNCQLDSLDGTFGLTSLRKLYAERNQITDVSPCSNLPHIQHIDVSHNRIRNISYAGFLSVCRKLRSIVFIGNPAASHPDYRCHVKNLLPRLESLDGVSFTNKEHRGASKIEQGELEDDFGEPFDDQIDLNDDVFQNGLLEDEKSVEAQSSCTSSNLDDEIQTILKYDGRKDCSLLSLRKERDESRHTVNDSRIEQETEEIFNNVYPSNNCKSEENLTLPPLTATQKNSKKMVHESLFPVACGRAELLKTKINEKQALDSLSSDAASVQDVEAMKMGARPKVLKKLDRPSTSTHIESMDNDLHKKEQAMKRPHTAGAQSKSEEGTGDESTRTFTQKSLTSGLPICGNLALAMRFRRRQERVEAEINKQKEVEELENVDME